MAGFIEDFYHGDFNPKEDINKPDPVLDAIEIKLAEIEDKLIESLQGENEINFNNYVKMSEHRLEIAKAKTFTEGFRKGSQFTHDAFLNN